MPFGILMSVSKQIDGVLTLPPELQRLFAVGR